MLNKKFRLTKRKEFGYIHKNGKRVFSASFTLIYTKTKLKNARIGFVITKKVGKAHVRNKIKRQMSEIVRNNFDLISDKFNYIFLAKPEIVNLTFAQLQKEIVATLSGFLNNIK